MAAPTQHQRPTSPATGSTRGRALTVLAAVAVPTVLWVVAAAVAGVELTVPQGEGTAPMRIGITAVVLSSLVASLAGWAALAVVERLLPSHARAVWTALAVAVLAVSFLPLFTAGPETATLVVLSAMHLAVAAVLIPLLPRRTTG